MRDTIGHRVETARIIVDTEHWARFGGSGGGRGERKVATIPGRVEREVGSIGGHGESEG